MVYTILLCLIGILAYIVLFRITSHCPKCNIRYSSDVRDGIMFLKCSKCGRVTY